MDLQQKIRTLPISAGVYLYKNAEGEVIYVGKANNLRSRVSSYFHEGRWRTPRPARWCGRRSTSTTSSSPTNKEALALENHLIKQKKPRFNILLRDDKTYPYVKLTLGERFPRVYVTRRLRKDGSAYYGPYFPANLAYRIVDLDPPALSGSVLQSGSHSLPSAALPAVLHQALSGPVRGGPDYAGDLSGSGPRREAVPRRPPDRSVAFLA